jgi:DNA primase
LYIPPETIDLIRDKAIIQDIIQKYVPSLKKKGKNYLGLCPFHKEKTASFTVSPDKQIFYCFGCHTGGNIFNFISKAERLDFPESVKFLAQLVGVEIRDEKRGDSGLFEAVNRLNRMAMELYHGHIKSIAGKKGNAYITGRGINSKSIDDFHIGYAPDSWDFLIKNFIKTKRDFEIAGMIGLIKQSQNKSDRFFDVFRNRVIFPIFDISGNPIGFGGRAIGDDPRKYINSSESPVFKKRDVLYGMNRARESIKEMARAIVVEGYLDVIGCHQAGIYNVVAPLGTAVTGEQIKILSHICTEIIFMFDADSAGIKAAIRSIEMTEDININVKVGLLPHGDPFEYITEKGAREFMAVVDSAMKPVDYKIARVMENNISGDSVNILLKLFDIIKDLKLETERSIYLKKISSTLAIDEKAVRSDFTSYLNKHQIKQAKSIQIPENDQIDFITRSYHDLIRLVCYYPDLIEKVVIDYNINDIPDQMSRNILKKMSELYSSDQDFSVDKIFDFFQGGSEMDFLTQILSNEYSVPNPAAVYTEIFINMKVREIDDKIDRYAALIQSSPDGRFHEYISEIEVLRREREKLSHYIYNKFTSSP